MTMQQKFEEAWGRASEDGSRNVSQEAAMFWFYAGAAAQKQTSPPIRASDVVTLELMRKPREAPAYREVGIGPDEMRRRFFLDLVRQHNLYFGITIHTDEDQIKFACECLKTLQEDGLKLESWVITNILANRVARILDYRGGQKLLQFIDALKHNATASGIPAPV